MVPEGTRVPLEDAEVAQATTTNKKRSLVSKIFSPLTSLVKPSTTTEYGVGLGASGQPEVVTGESRIPRFLKYTPWGYAAARGLAARDLQQKTMGIQAEALRTKLEHEQATARMLNAQSLKMLRIPPTISYDTTRGGFAIADPDAALNGSADAVKFIPLGKANPEEINSANQQLLNLIPEALRDTPEFRVGYAHALDKASKTSNPQIVADFLDSSTKKWAEQQFQLQRSMLMRDYIFGQQTSEESIDAAAKRAYATGMAGEAGRRAAQTQAQPGESLDSLAQAVANGIAPLTAIPANNRVALIKRMEELGLRAPLGANSAKIIHNASSGLRALAKMEKMIKANPNVLVWAAMPGKLGAREFDTARREVADVITRLRTGAALNEEEQRFYGSQMPTALDLSEKANIWNKISMYRQLFEDLGGREDSGVSATPRSLTKKKLVFNPNTMKVEER